MPASAPPWIPIVAALTGALLAGLLQWVTGILNRRRERAATLVALVSEIGVMSELLRRERYIDELERIIGECEEGQEATRPRARLVNGDRFPVFDSLAPRLGLLREDQARSVVQFYSLYRYATGILDEASEGEGAREVKPGLVEYRQARDVLVTLAALGDRIGIYIDRRRFLTPGEMDLAQSIFGSPESFLKATVALKKNSKLLGENVFLTLRKQIYVKPDGGLWSEDYSREPAHKQGAFVHQLAHIWQLNRLGTPFFYLRYAWDFMRCGFRLPAMYSYVAGETLFSETSLEAQAEMLGDLCVARLTGDQARAELISKSLGNSGPIRAPR